MSFQFPDQSVSTTYTSPNGENFGLYKWRLGSR